MAPFFRHHTKKRIMATEAKSTTSESKGSSSKSHTTTDQIKRWVEERGGKPATVKGTEKEAGVLRIDFPGYSGEDSLLSSGILLAAGMAFFCAALLHLTFLKVPAC
jgi:hypothetical protein